MVPSCCNSNSCVACQPKGVQHFSPRAGALSPESCWRWEQLCPAELLKLPADDMSGGEL